MSRAFTELGQAEFDALIERVEQAAAHDLALSGEDLRLLLEALLMLAQLQERMADQDITLHKLRKLAGIVRKSEKLGAVLPSADKPNRPKKTNKRPKSEPKAPGERTIHERCTHRHRGAGERPALSGVRAREAVQIRSGGGVAHQRSDPVTLHRAFAGAPAL